MKRSTCLLFASLMISNFSVHADDPPKVENQQARLDAFIIESRERMDKMQAALDALIKKNKQSNNREASLPSKIRLSNEVSGEAEFTGGVINIPATIASASKKHMVRIDHGDLDLNISDGRLGPNHYILTSIRSYSPEYSYTPRLLFARLVTDEDHGNIWGNAPSIIYGFELSVMQETSYIKLYPNNAIESADAHSVATSPINETDREDGEYMRIYINRRVLDRYSRGIKVTGWELYEWK